MSIEQLAAELYDPLAGLESAVLVLEPVIEPTITAVVTALVSSLSIVAALKAVNMLPLDQMAAQRGVAAVCKRARVRKDVPAPVRTWLRT